MNRFSFMLSLLLILVLVYACRQDTYQPAHLTYLSPEEKLVSLREDFPTSPYVVFRDSLGNALSPDLRDKLDRGELYQESYINQDGEIEEVIVREMQPKYELWAALERLSQRRGNFETVSLNCMDKRKLLRIIYKKHNKYIKDTTIRDQMNYDEVRKHRNTVLTILEHCGFPGKEEVGKEGLIGVFYGLTFENGGWLARYYSSFKERVDRGEMPKEFLARIEDWALSFSNRPQKYGTHYRYNYRTETYEIGPIRDSINVDKRRAEVGLEPLAKQELGSEKKANSLQRQSRRPPLFPPQDSLVWQNMLFNFDSIHPQQFLLKEGRDQE